METPDSIEKARVYITTLDKTDPINNSYIKIAERLILLSEETGVDFQTLYSEFLNVLEQTYQKAEVHPS